MNNKLANVVVMLLLTQFCILPVHAASPVDTPVPFNKPLPASSISGTQSAESPEPATSVLERFRTHTGPRSPVALTALFAAPVTTTIRQQPEVALSDGATTVKVTIAAGSQYRTAPNIAFDGTRLISLKHNKADEWDIEVLPAEGIWNASLILLTGSDTRVVPLAVAPKLPTGTDLSEQGFITFLNGTKASALPLLDLNDDGLRDYVDDYIFTANYLVRLSTSEAVSATGQSSETQDPSTTQKADVQDPVAGLNSDLQGSGSIQSSDLQESTSGQGSNAQGSYSGRDSIPQTSPGITAPATVPAPAPEIKLDTSPDRHNLTNRNERARKIKELLSAPSQ